MPGQVRSGRSGLAAIFGLAALLFFVSGWAAYQEAAPLLLRASAFEKRRLSITEAASKEWPISLWESRTARRARIQTCLNTIREANQTAARSPAMIQELEEACLALIKSSLSRAPMSPNDWFVAAAIAWQLGEEKNTRAFLEMSYRTGPNEGWIAERRALFGFRIRENLPAHLLPNIEADLLLLLRTRSGMRVLARQYVHDVPLREHLVRLAEALPEPVQQEFLTTVREEVQARSNKVGTRVSR